MAPTTTNRLRVAGTSLLALAFLASAWSLPAWAADQTVVIGEALRPANLEIEPGTTVTWHNRDDERHRVRSKDGPVRFDSKDLDPGSPSASPSAWPARIRTTTIGTVTTWPTWGR